MTNPPRCICSAVISSSAAVFSVQQLAVQQMLGQLRKALDGEALRSGKMQHLRVGWEAVLCKGDDRLDEVRPRQRAMPPVQQLQAPQLQRHRNCQAARDCRRRIAYMSTN